MKEGVYGSTEEASGATRSNEGARSSGVAEIGTVELSRCYATVMSRGQYSDRMLVQRPKSNRPLEVAENDVRFVGQESQNQINNGGRGSQFSMLGKKQNIGLYGEGSAARGVTPLMDISNMESAEIVAEFPGLNAHDEREGKRTNGMLVRSVGHARRDNSAGGKT